VLDKNIANYEEEFCGKVREKTDEGKSPILL